MTGAARCGQYRVLLKRGEHPTTLLGLKLDKVDVGALGWLLPMLCGIGSMRTVPTVHGFRKTRFAIRVCFTVDCR